MWTDGLTNVRTDIKTSFIKWTLRSQSKMHNILTPFTADASVDRRVVKAPVLLRLSSKYAIS